MNIGLTEYIVEAFNLFGFIDQLSKKEYPRLNIFRTELERDVYDIIQAIVKVYGSDEPRIILDKTNRLFKIPRKYEQLLPSGEVYLPSGNYVEFIKTDKDVKVYWVAATIKKRVEICRLGNGSRVNTASQEQGTVVLWNEFVRSAETLESDLEANDYEFIKVNLKELSKDLIQDTSWLKSYKAQLIALVHFLEKKGLNPLDYRAFRYSETNEIYPGVTKVSNAYKKFQDIYKTQIKKQYDHEVVSRDNFNPTDIILFKIGEDVISDIDKLTDLASQLGKENSSLASLYELYQNLYKKNILFGVSLKKIDTGTGKVEPFNINKDDPSSHTVEIKKVHMQSEDKKRNQLRFQCTGTFNFSGTVDPRTVDTNPTDLETKTIDLCLRDYGGARGAGLDARFGKEAILGKVPRYKLVHWLNPSHNTHTNAFLESFWQRFANVSLKEIQESDEVYKRAIETAEQNLNQDSVKKELESLVASAIKNGPWCLPFVLSH